MFGRTVEQESPLRLLHLAAAIVCLVACFVCLLFNASDLGSRFLPSGFLFSLLGMMENHVAEKLKMKWSSGHTRIPGS